MNDVRNYSEKRRQQIENFLEQLLSLPQENQFDNSKRRYNPIKLCQYYNKNIEQFQQGSELIESDLLIQLYGDVLQNQLQKKRRTKTYYQLVDPFNFEWDRNSVSEGLYQEFQTIKQDEQKYQNSIEELQKIDLRVTKIFNKIEYSNIQVNMEQLIDFILDQINLTELKEFPLISIYVFLSSVIYKSNLDLKLQKLYCECLIPSSWNQNTQQKYEKIFKQKPEIKTKIQNDANEKQISFSLYIHQNIIQIIQFYQIYSWKPISDVYRQQNESEAYFSKLKHQYMRNNSQLLGFLFYYDLITLQSIKIIIYSLTFSKIGKEEKILLLKQFQKRENEINMDNIQYLTTLYNNILQVLYWKSDIQILKILIQKNKKIHIESKKIQNEIYKLSDIFDELQNQENQNLISENMKNQHKINFQIYSELIELYEENILNQVQKMDSVNQFQIEEIQYQIKVHFTGQAIWIYKIVLQLIEKIKPLQQQVEKEKALEVTQENFKEFLAVFNEAEFKQACKEVFKLNLQSSKSDFRKVMGELISIISDYQLKSKVFNQLMTQMIQFSKQYEYKEYFEQQICSNPMQFKDLIKKQNSLQMFLIFIKNNAIGIIQFIQSLIDYQIQNRDQILEQILKDILFDEEADPIDNLLCLIDEKQVYQFIKILSKFYGKSIKEILELLSDDYEMEEIVPLFNKQKIDTQGIQEVVDDCCNETQENIKQVLQKILQEQNQQTIQLLQQLSKQNKIEEKTISEVLNYIYDNSMKDMDILINILNQLNNSKCFDMQKICQELSQNEDINKQLKFSLFKNKNKIQ